jgi:hypothetical protein
MFSPIGLFKGNEIGFDTFKKKTARIKKDQMINKGPLSLPGRLSAWRKDDV